MGHPKKVGEFPESRRQRPNGLGLVDVFSIGLVNQVMDCTAHSVVDVGSGDRIQRRR